ncbi:KpsF/GutQ family sugar-phosphate isomerase [Campylobacter molothri]|uniref:KpsF/GutQ family sugar-phosphate isomerase n=1 Tax=Campylobacter molothri TaxID=1032242 RepID=UPI001D3FE3E0|nr:KpsF/GutQ family sugar-phosphate isomerase [Campylobacter sp. RM10542]MBZ7930559.1 KpsF/GutQ family sugar-phosphate isomerase [Campylobacter sp. W0067]MBZ7934936.1 KpsF/GutQ family sugar-phosphate isomerase [Campylobacter sp. W0065]MBZ7944334.1 KpsF/GutQ family sugar-phosphate isomerase [Campylobacter sp. RM13744]MBZ7947211.1 KpsF/GutQ family sugar-phosphate isomerase [Campylobacter sp. RM10536]MBZ7953137.1 KpsF/GutQ family sugar-phosphate isomerase [Campylobacter sp. RM9939]MBZ7957517.1 K
MEAIEIAKEVFRIEAESISDLASHLDENFNQAVEFIFHSQGRCIVSGMGKSGHIGAKIAATLASTGTPSFFVHPGEALHGDLGMITPQDVLIAISNSGETEELLKIIPVIKRRKITLIAMTGNLNSTLAKQADVSLDISIKKEACPLKLAPMSSTTATLVMGDALAAVLMKKKNFKPDDFALFHPGGSLGRKLLTKVKDLMVSRNLPIVHPQTEFNDLVNVMTSGKLGLCIVLENENLVGIITDGDLRRALKTNDKPRFDFKAKEIMSNNPKVIDADAMASEAEELMLKHKIKEIVVGKDGKVVGIIQLYAIGNV